MIKNPAPAAMVLGSLSTGYTMLMVYHSAYSDPDTVSKSFWLVKNGVETRIDDPGITTQYAILTGLESGAAYTMSGAYIDSMVDEELLDAKISVNLSIPKTFTTKVKPFIVDYRSEYDNTGIGSGIPYLFINVDGDADFVEIELSLDGVQWDQVYRGDSSSEITITNIASGTYKARVRGIVNFSDGVSKDVSPWTLFGEDLVVDFTFRPPSKPSNINFNVARIQDSMERYDVQVVWDWEKGTGAQIKEFVVYYTSAESFAANGWSKALRVNTGGSTSCVISNFPKDIQHVFKVVATSWGSNAEEGSSPSEDVTFILTDDTPINDEFTKLTGIEVSYSHIKASANVNGEWLQTFLLDAKTGNLSIGMLDENGVAPISVDAARKVVHVDGRVITKEINAASFILTNLSGKDNPALYSEGKTYGSNVSGIWMGMDNKSGKALFDLGNDKNFLRWDGEKLNISGSVIIDSNGNEVSLEEGLKGNFLVYIYKVDTKRPTTPTSQDYPPPGWSAKPPLVNDPFKEVIYSSTGQLDPATKKLVDGTNYSEPVQWSGTTGTDGKQGPPVNSNLITGTSSFEVMDNSNTNIGKGEQLPNMGGMSLDSWNLLRGKQVTLSCRIDTQGITEGNHRLGVEIPVTYEDGTTEWIGAWYALPAPFIGRISRTHTIQNKKITAVGVGIYIQGKTTYSRVNQVKLEEGDLATAWIDAGLDGVQGTNGPGFYTQPRGAAGWSDADAKSFFNSNFGRNPAKYDVLTQYNTNNPKQAESRQWNGSAWTKPALMVHGDQVLDGTLTAKKLVADQAFLATLGVNYIYDNAAALSSNPEANYKMKIDLANGSIHIR